MLNATSTSQDNLLALFLLKNSKDLIINHPLDRIMRNRIIIIAVAIVVVAIIAATAAAYLESNNSQPMKGTISVLTTFYPIFDFTQNVAGDKANVTLLVPMTTDVHDFEPTPSDIQKVVSADVLIYNGAGLEPWINQIIAAANNPHLVVIDTSQGITLLPVPQEFQKDNRTVDPHIWLDPLLAKQQVENILQGLVKADPQDQQYFTANARAYEAELDQLNSQIINETSNVKTTVFVTFHEAFAYFAKQYNLTQIPISGPFEEEPTPGDIQNVITAIKQYHLCYVGYESLENPAISASIASQTNATLIQMNPIEGLTASDQAAGKTYLTLMQQDVTNIAKALNSIGCS
jgi:zinc transport system substrate-binding protein